MSLPQRLSLEYLPPWQRIFAFLNMAPWWAAAGWLLLAAQDVSRSPFHRLAPSVIGAVHLLTLGWLMHVWIAATVQFSAVMSAIRLPQERRWMALWRGGLFLGAGLFALGLVTSVQGLVQAGVVVLAPTLLSYTMVMLGLAVRQRAYAELIQAWAGLVLVVFLGWQQAALHHGQMDWVWLQPDARWTNVHVFVAISAWAGVLIVAVSSRFVPMFFVTPPVGTGWRVGTAAILGLAPLIALTLAMAGVWAALPGLIVMAAWTAAVYFGRILFCLNARRRALTEPAILMWKTLAVITLLAAVLTTLGWRWPEAVNVFAVGALWLWGVISGVVIAMLFKIVPFLSYLHLQRAAAGDYSRIRRLPGMRVFWSPEHQQRLVWMHLATCGLLCGSALNMMPVWTAALTAALEAGLIGQATGRSCRLFRTAKKELNAGVAASQG